MGGWVKVGGGGLEEDKGEYGIFSHPISFQLKNKAYIEGIYENLLHFICISVWIHQSIKFRL